jgi:hypothetical protein
MEDKFLGKCKLKPVCEEAKWRIADGPWNLDLHDLKKNYSRFSWQHRWGNTASSANEDTTNHRGGTYVFD